MDKRLMIALGVAAGGAALGVVIDPRNLFSGITGAPFTWGALEGAAAGWVMANVGYALYERGRGKALRSVIGKVFHISMIAALIILALALIRILIHHYWFLFFVWLALPFSALWLAGDFMRHHLSLKQIKMARGVLVGAATILAFINLVNMNQLRFDFGKRFVDGYKITVVHDCEADSDAIQDQSLVAGALPGTCKEENLSEVAWYWRWVLRLSDWGYAFLAFIVVAGTTLISKSTVEKKAEEDWHENHPDGERFSLVKK